MTKLSNLTIIAWASNHDCSNTIGHVIASITNHDLDAMEQAWSNPSRDMALNIARSATHSWSLDPSEQMWNKTQTLEDFLWTLDYDGLDIHNPDAPWMFQ